ncbi:hypothetical protein DS909_01640 [Phaeobacter gallaeciensis]|uniref:Uncharacterized protein n=2 Tax=Roseobacteraceae TaxID=2854170 RepID=A0A366X967_9RHOB|nr:hypothetical protein DS909_01640 [Phaeobacter gallaeciensis]
MLFLLFKVSDAGGAMRSRVAPSAPRWEESAGFGFGVQGEASKPPMMLLGQRNAFGVDLGDGFRDPTCSVAKHKRGK